MNIWHDISENRINKDSFLGVVEIEKGGKNKYELDKETGMLKLDRVLYTATHYPTNYGFIPRTYAEDNDPLDVLILCEENILPLTLVECYPIGVLIMNDAGEEDEKIIAVSKQDPYLNSYKDISELPEQISDEINAEYLKVKYKLTMLEILELLVKKIDGYSSFIEKRTAMLDLIKYRLVCMESLGIKNSVDPFSRIKVKEQLDVVRSLTDNSKIVSDMMHKISGMNSNVEAMIFQNNGYLITINDTRKIIVDKRSFNDIDIAPLVAFDELLVKQSVLDNQVIDVKQAGYMFNMGIISQKTASVIKRVNQMINESSVQKDSVQVKKVEETVPELVIVPVKVKEEPIVLEPVLEVPVMEEIKVEPVDKVEVEEVKELPLVAPVVEPVLDIVKSEPVETQPVVDIFSQQNDLFETITPFAEPTFFVDRADTDVDKTKSVVQQPFQLDNIELIPSVLEKEDVPVIDSMDESMPEVFWVTQEDDGIKTEETNNVLSFDEQINALLSNNDNENAKVRKKVA